MAKKLAANSTPQSPRNVFSILPPSPNGPGKYTLVVMRPMSGAGPFGQSGGAVSAIFSVDGMFPVNDGRNAATHFRAFRYVGEAKAMDVVVEFPISASFLLVKNDQVQFSTQEESLREALAQEKTLRAIEEEAMGTGEAKPTAPVSPVVGQYL